MQLPIALISLALIAATHAQTPQFFPIVSEKPLEVLYGHPVSLNITPGLLVARNDVLTQPSVFRPATANASLYVLFLVDEDVPRNGTKVQLLHWLQPNLVATADNANLTLDVTATGASSAVGAPYLPPTPPGGDGAHRYTFLLYEQPAMWSVPSNYSEINPPASSSARVGFNITDFVAATGLGEVLGSNFLRVLNGTAEESSSAASATGTAAPAGATNGTATATATASGSGSASGSGAGASASATSSSSSAAGLVGPYSSARELVMGVALALVGASAWML